MKVFLLKDVQNVGMAGEILKVKEGFALNFLIPHKIAVKITPENEKFYSQKIKMVEHRKEVIVSKTSMLAEKIKDIVLILKRKTHNDGKLYGAVSQSEIADLLLLHGVSVGKSQIEFDKSIKEKGLYTITVKLTTKLKPQVQLKIVPEVSHGA